jgi:hypothetical protein
MTGQTSCAHSVPPRRRAVCSASIVCPQALQIFPAAWAQVNRIEATTEITNVAEQRALEKAGFTREGILRGTTFRQGRRHDQVIYSVLRDEVKLQGSAAADGQV